MGRDFYCDMCGKSVPLDSSLNKIVVGGQEIAEACYNCSETLKGSLRNASATSQKTRAAAPAPAVQPGPTPPPEQPDTKPSSEVTSTNSVSTSAALKVEADEVPKVEDLETEKPK